MEEALRLAQLQLRQAEVRAEVWESQATARNGSKGAAADDANRRNALAVQMGSIRRLPSRQRMSRRMARAW